MLRSFVFVISLLLKAIFRFIALCTCHSLVFNPLFLVWADSHQRAGALKVTIPSFGPSGEVIWRLKAEEVTPLDQSQYHVLSPNLITISQNSFLTDAWSKEGLFDIKNGIAKGNSILEVKGIGFQAKGKTWEWRERDSMGIHRMTLADKGVVKFDSSVPAILTTTNSAEPKVNDLLSEENKGVPVEETIASAEVIEFLSYESGAYKFSLAGNVFIEGQDLSISCSNMEIIIDRDDNQSESKFGSISSVFAEGQVEMKQIGRICRANQITLNTLDGTGVLEGNASVEDEQWGTATGERILLDKSSGKARVEGMEKQRPQVVLPNLGEFRLPGFKSTK